MRGSLGLSRPMHRAATGASGRGAHLGEVGERDGFMLGVGAPYLNWDRGGSVFYECNDFAWMRQQRHIARLDYNRLRRSREGLLWRDRPARATATRNRPD
jgi:hypothetical protein